MAAFRIGGAVGGWRLAGAAFSNLDAALTAPGTQLRLFGKPEVDGRRRLGVGLAMADDVDAARAKARAVVDAIEVKL